MTLSSYEAHWRRWPDFRRRVAEARAFARLRLGAGIAAGQRAEIEFEVSDEMEAGLSIADRINLARRHKSR